MKNARDAAAITAVAAHPQIAIDRDSVSRPMTLGLRTISIITAISGAASTTPLPASCSGSSGTCPKWESTSTMKAGVSRSWIWTGAALTRCWRSRQKLKSLETGHAHLLCYDVIAEGLNDKMD